MHARYASFLGLFLIGCGGVVTPTSDQQVADSGADARSDTLEVDLDAPSAIDSTPPMSDVTPSCPCVGDTWSWQLDGGLVASVQASSLGPCAVYGHSSQFGGSPQPLKCSQPLPDCGSALLDIGDAYPVLYNPDLTAAFSNPPAIYGQDNRGGDGQVLIVSNGSKSITIGDTCSGNGPLCTPIPSAVANLRDLLMNLDAQETQRAECGQVLHGK